MIRQPKCNLQILDFRIILIVFIYKVSELHCLDIDNQLKLSSGMNLELHLLMKGNVENFMHLEDNFHFILECFRYTENTKEIFNYKKHTFEKEQINLKVSH
jgi:hypothetical protein